MLSINKISQHMIICSVILMMTFSTVQAQVTQPTWWFGLSGAANANFYSGTTQRLNNTLVVPTAFHDGFGVRPFGSVFVEYRPAGRFGVMLNAGYDGRGAKFDDVIAPCDCPATLKTDVSYITIEPSLRFALPSSNLYFFAGPRIAFSQNKDFSYTQLKQPNTDAELSSPRSTLLSGQVGLGYEIPLSAPTSVTQVNLSPFVSYHPYFGQDPRDIESLSITTVRAGIALKIGKGGKVKDVTPPVADIPLRDVTFAARAPLTQSVKRQISETLPLRNSVFFDEESTNVPGRYILLTANQASSFKEEQLQQEPEGGSAQRSARQMKVYYNIMNILGDRMRANPAANISLSGASGKGPAEGVIFAQNVKQYLVTVFGINPSRIETLGRTKPVIPSEKPGATKELVLLRAGDRRVDIQSSSSQLLTEVGGGIMQPVQIITNTNPLDSQVLFTTDGAELLLKSYVIELADENGNIQKIGPFTADQANVTANSILGDRASGTYKVTMRGERKNGSITSKESSISLTRSDDLVQKAYRYSVLYDFDKAQTVASYAKFLTDVVSPLVSDGSTVIIHGHTDIIGSSDYNLNLSNERAAETQKIIENTTAKNGIKNVKFETSGFGEDISRSPFENNLPEERFYNRTVIIDIIPLK